MEFKLCMMALLAIFVVSPSQGQEPVQSKCVDEFSQVLTTCVTEAGLTAGNFFWFVTNGTSQKSVAPADEAAFKTKVCSVRQQVGACTVHKMNPILNSSACSGPSANYVDVIRNQLTLLFTTYDTKCMHQCRATLIPDIRECYSSNGADPKLFASNSSNGAVIGTTESDVNKFCGAKDKIIPCMQTKIDACPEAPLILQAVGIDFQIFGTVVNILCANSQAYLSSLSCLAYSANDVDQCQQRHGQSMMQLDMQARQNSWSEERIIESICHLSLEQIRCDINSWARKSHKSCNQKEVIEFRRQLACEFMTPQCKANKNLMDRQDNPCKAQSKPSGQTGQAHDQGHSQVQGHNQTQSHGQEQSHGQDKGHSQSQGHGQEKVQGQGQGNEHSKFQGQGQSNGHA
ncbi:hypothetical protein Btru_030311 [Bulinus truncatus]|nr:hypothetical protein Btru_030311 [Bulinus truncatus]